MTLIRFHMFSVNEFSLMQHIQSQLVFIEMSTWRGDLKAWLSALIFKDLKDIVYTYISCFY